jgi:hypothetical protein
MIDDDHFGWCSPVPDLISTIKVAPMSEVIHALARREVSFGPEDIAVLAAGLESALTNLHITNRNDPATTAVAKLIIQLARDGECDPTRLAIRAIEIVRGSS